MTPIIGLINNAALLVALGVLLDFFLRMKRSSEFWTRIFTGVALGVIGVAIIMNRWTFGHGIVFDTRSIILSLGGLFFGTVPAVIAIAIIGAFRVYMGGAGMWMGLGVIFTSGVIGILWRNFRGKRPAPIGAMELLVFGLVVHVSMMLWTFSLPEEHVREVLVNIGLPVLVIYPLATVLLGSLLSSQLAHRQVQEDLEESERKYRLLADGAMEGILVAQDGMLRFANPRALEIIGYTEPELLDTPFTNFIHPDDREMVLDRHYRRLKGEVLPSRYPIRILSKDGAQKFIEIDSGMIAWDKKPATLVFLTEITERVAMENALRESEEWYRNLVELSFDGIFVQEGPKIVFVNSRLYEMLGYENGDLVGMDHWVLYDAEYQKLTRERAAARMRGEPVPSQYEVKLRRKDGSSFYGEINAKKILIHGNPGIQVWVRDVSARIKFEESRKRLATAIEQAAEAIMITDADGTTQYVNPAFQLVTGYSYEEIVGKNPRLLKSGKHDSHFYRNLWETISSGTVWKGRLTNKRKDGSLYQEEATISPVRDSTGKIINYVAVKRDISEEVSLQAKLLQAQKMEAVGTLAGGIAHDFNNLLQIIVGYGEMMLSKQKPDERGYSDLRKILDAAHSGSELVKRLLTFSRKIEPKLQSINLNDRVKNVEALLRRTLPRMIEIELRLQERLPLIYADSTQIDQILLNLSLNARDAMPDEGRLTIETSSVTLDDEYCQSHIDATPGEHVLLKIIDTGHGISKEELEHIFEPFYTTKELGRGTGLGLATVYGIVQQHGGHIVCESELGKGTGFLIYFPRNDNPSQILEQVEQVIPGLGNETILVVEDEAPLRDLAERFLAESGYKVLLASNGHQGIEIYNQNRNEIALVILDWIMPEMGGRECLDRLRRIDPKVRVIIASGYTMDTSRVEVLETMAAGIVNKPYRLIEMLSVVRNALDRG